MRYSGTILLGVCGAILAVAGCAQVASHAPPSSPSTISLSDVPRGSVEADIQSLPSAPNASATAQPDPLPKAAYKALSPFECQCMAVEAAPGAKSYTLETQANRLRLIGRNSERSTLKRDLLFLGAREIQNRSAGTALETYFRIAEAEGKSELLSKGLEQLEIVTRETRELVEQKLRPHVALDVWQRQSLSMQSDRLIAESTIDQLNSDLRRLVDLPADGRWRIWNPDGFQVDDEVIDIESAIAEGLNNRAELQALCRAVTALSPGTLPEVRGLLKSLDPRLGSGTPTHPLMLLIARLGLDRTVRAEAEIRRRQLCELLRERETAVAEEVRQAATTVMYRSRMVALAWEREKSWAEKNREVESRRKQGLASFAEVTPTMLDWLKARGDLVQEIMNWHIARVKLRQAQGLLPRDCECQ